jgi:hypothetical protein
MAKLLGIALLVPLLMASADPSPPLWGGAPEFAVRVNLTNPNPVA